MSAVLTPRSLDVAYARLGSLLTRVLAARWRSPGSVTFTNQRSLLHHRTPGTASRATTTHLTGGLS